MRYMKILVLFFSCFAVSSAWAAEDNLCFKCHDQKKFVNRVTHQPVAEGNCNYCHNPHVAKYPGLLQNKIADICNGCHEGIGGSSESTLIHKPVREGDCLACHNPHASATKGLLKGTKPGEVCFNCHDQLVKKYENTHSPYAKGQCVSCHLPHQAKQIQLLKEDGDKLCRSCHKGDLTSSHPKFPLKPASCLTCHNPHGSSRADLVRDILHDPYASGCDDCHENGSIPGAAKCLECHPEVQDKLKAVHNHLTGSVGNSCTQCHSPHASDSEDLFRNRQEQVCRKCHYDTYKSYVDKPHSHPLPGSCSNCHEVHGSNNMAMLKGDGNQVCSSCHASQGQFTHPVGEGVFDPRTGVILTCVACHYPHGTDYTNNLKLEGSKDLCVQCHRGY